MIKIFLLKISVISDSNFQWENIMTKFKINDMIYLKRGMI